MSDQPTTSRTKLCLLGDYDENCPHCQPKPTTGVEWTAEYVRSIAIAPDQYTRIAAAHNAALADAYEKGRKDEQDHNRFAAERSRADNAEARYASMDTMEADALREQLAAERERANELSAISQRLCDQLAAALAKIRKYPIREGCEIYYDHREGGEKE